MTFSSARIPVGDPESVPQEDPAGPTLPANRVSPIPGAAGTAAPQRFSFVISRVAGTVVVTTHGLLDPNGGRALGSALLDLVDHQGNLAVVVDVADLHLSDHMCLVALTPAASAAARRGGRLTLADPTEALARGLMLTGLAGMVSVTTSGRSRSDTPALGGAARNGARRAAMAQHPAGSATTPTAITTNTQGAAQ